MSGTTRAVRLDAHPGAAVVRPPSSRPLSASPGRVRGRGGGAVRATGGALLATALAALALVLRVYRIRRSYELFVDELSYAALGRSLATGGGVVLNGQPFFLHPPVFFLEIAAAIRATGVRRGPGGLLATALGMRPLDAVAGAVGVGVAVVLLLRVAGWLAAAAGGLLLAGDPFLIRFDSRLLLEAPAMLPATIGVLLLTVVPSTRRRAVGWGLLAGLAFAVSSTTKDLYVFVGVLPALALAVVTRGAARTRSATAVVATAVGYVVYVATVVAGDAGGTWWAEKTVGVRRALGLVQQTGFNRTGAPSLASRLAANATTTSVSYLLIAAGSAAALLVLATAVRRRRTAPVPAGAVVVATWCTGAVVLLSYEIVLGTLEEQMFYPLLVTSTVALCSGLRVLADRVPAGSLRRVGTVAAAVLLAAAVAADLASWRITHGTPDDAYERTLAWTAASLPDGSRVAATEDTAQFVLTGVRIGQESTVPALVADHVDYVLISTALVQQGYGVAGPGLLHTLETRAVLVHSESGRTLGQLRVYDVRRLVAAGRAARATAVAPPGRPGTTPPSASPTPSAAPPLPPADTVPIFPDGTS